MLKNDKKYFIFSYIILGILAFFMIFPFLWMIFSSFKPSWEIYDMKLLPSSPTLENYKNIFTFSGFPKWFLNSSIVAFITTFSVLFFDSLVGFTLAKYKFPGRNILFILILSTLMIPTEMLVIPWYTMSQKLNWMGSYWSLMFPGMISGFGIFLMKQFMETIPDELLDAARIDGLSEFKIYWKIVLPLVKPALGTLAIFNFIGNWNAFLWPLIVAQDSNMYTLPVGMAYFSSEASFQWEQIMTGATISTIPLIIFFLIFQKQIIQGIATQGLKG
ncbi:carbohydrate ABC transporter permease [Oceanotoga sp. DSM 15011]|uniref:carbohydrate ABC transporter permease n=1 Tax=Oceanotoga sp. DSM 15011 TaxID=2984951 RepID=UPI0021F40C5F|nr:carbohydrate ABC transporter permease [Oceanotoga sp. DSM 15011]UYO99150.1 carbohydrate ABC transporter permease [Oceanotoga sp. DSM 15011]